MPFAGAGDALDQNPGSSNLIHQDPHSHVEMLHSWTFPEAMDLAGSRGLCRRPRALLEAACSRRSSVLISQAHCLPASRHSLFQTSIDLFQAPRALIQTLSAIQTLSTAAKIASLQDRVIETCDLRVQATARARLHRTRCRHTPKPRRDKASAKGQVSLGWLLGEIENHEKRTLRGLRLPQGALLPADSKSSRLNNHHARTVLAPEKSSRQSRE